MDQFVTEELIYALVDDGEFLQMCSLAVSTKEILFKNILFNKNHNKKGYLSAHPVDKPFYKSSDYYAYFDYVESSKAAAILRMVDAEIDQGLMLKAMKVIFF